LPVLPVVLLLVVTVFQTRLQGHRLIMRAAAQDANGIPPLRLQVTLSVAEGQEQWQQTEQTVKVAAVEVRPQRQKPQTLVVTVAMV
jgi:hypothetical protein